MKGVFTYYNGDHQITELDRSIQSEAGVVSKEQGIVVLSFEHCYTYSLNNIKFPIQKHPCFNEFSSPP
jgi:hypothetical protein